MNPKAQQYHQDLLEKIPISQHLGIEIAQLSDQNVTLRAPLRENINYEGVVFGGSLNTVAVLSCYLMLRHLLLSRNIPFSSLVIQSSEIRYL